MICVTASARPARKPGARPPMPKPASAMRRAGSFLAENPLMIGALGLAIGAVVAAALPATRREGRMAGQRRPAVALTGLARLPAYDAAARSG